MLPAPQSAQEWPHYLPSPCCFLPSPCFESLSAFLSNPLLKLCHFYLNHAACFHDFPSVPHAAELTVLNCVPGLLQYFLIGILTSNLLSSSIYDSCHHHPSLPKQRLLNNFLYEMPTLPSIIKRVKYKLFSLAFYLPSHQKPHYISNCSHQSL